MQTSFALVRFLQKWTRSSTWILLRLWTAFTERFQQWLWFAGPVDCYRVTYFCISVFLYKMYFVVLVLAAVLAAVVCIWAVLTPPPGGQKHQVKYCINCTKSKLSKSDTHTLCFHCLGPDHPINMWPMSGPYYRRITPSFPPPDYLESF